MSHPDPNAWSMNVNPYFSWTLPRGDANHSGVYYAFDHHGTTVPTRADTLVPVVQHQVLRSGVPAGIWAFHAVSVDTVGNPTRNAAHYLVRIGQDPGSGRLLGQVGSAAGNVANATVSINRGLFPTQATNSGGTFDFASVTAGTWEVSVTAGGFKPATQMVTIPAGGQATANFTLTP